MKKESAIQIEKEGITMTNEKAIFGLEGLVYKKRGALADPVYIYKGASINSNDLWDDL